MRANSCSRAALGCQDARLWPSAGARVVTGTCGGLCGCPPRAFGRLRSGWPAGRQSQRRPAARALLRALAARDGEAGEPQLAYPGSQGARPPTLAGRGEAALYRRAAQEHPRYTQHKPPLLPGTEGQQGGPAPSGRAGGLSAPVPDAALQQLAAPQGGERRHALVHFCCHYRAEYGQRLRMVGSHANLGAPPVLAKCGFHSVRRPVTFSVLATPVAAADSRECSQGRGSTLCGVLQSGKKGRALTVGQASAGSWVLADGPEMEWSPGDLWRADVALPAGGVYEYKYVLVGGGAGGRHALAWQRGNNSVLALAASESEAEVRLCVPCLRCWQSQSLLLLHWQQ